MKTALNLGAQIHHFDSHNGTTWINQDIVTDDPNIMVEWKCDANKLPTEDETIDFIYAGHLLEHTFPDTAETYIKEWYRVLKKGGRMVIVVPDCGMVFRDYADGKLKGIEDIWQQIYGRIYSWDRKEEQHHFAFDRETLIKYLSCVSWESIDGLDFYYPPEELRFVMGEHVSVGGYQIGLVLKK